MKAVPSTSSVLLASLVERVRRYEDDADPWLRALVATRVYRDMPGLTRVAKQAEVVALALEGVEPALLPGELMAGRAYRRLRVHEGVSDPDSWRMSALHVERHGFREEWPAPEEVRAELRWWGGPGRVVRAPQEERRRHAWLYRYGVAHPHGNLDGHTLPDYGILMAEGGGGLRRRIESRLGEARTEAERDQLRAMERCLEGLSRHAARHAEAALALAGTTADGVLSARLRAVAASCSRVATERPAGLHEALQLLFFAGFADALETPGDAHSLGRADQYLFPFYRADVEGGRLDRGSAFELVCHFVAKSWSEQTSSNVTLGGLTRDGRDATNDLSWMFLDAMVETGLPTDLTVRLHPGTPPEYVRRVVEVVRMGFGRPSLYNDDVTVEALVRKGVSVEDARDYAPLGCAEVMLPGRSAYRTMCMGMNLAKAVELAVTGGRCLVTGDQVLPDVPDSHGTFESFRAAYRGVVRRAANAGMDVIREDERTEPVFWPRPFLSLLAHGCVEKALDVTAGAPEYDPVGVTADGLADAMNSLLAVRRLVFEEGRLTLAGLREVLARDWRGEEALRQYALNRLPRFGLDDPEVNALAREEAAFYASCFEGERTLYGGRFMPMVFGVTTTMMVNAARKTGALPSGRRGGDALAASFQPSPLGRRPCATELLRAVASVDFLDFAGGVSNVQEMDPSLVEGEEGLGRLADLVAGFFALGGMELSLNFLDERKLREAQADPDRHRFLMVRLFGLSARFVNLSREVQESVVERVRAASCGRQGRPGCV